MTLFLVGCMDFGDEYTPSLGISQHVVCTVAPELQVSAHTLGPILSVTFTAVLSDGAEESIELGMLDRAEGRWASVWTGPSEWTECEDTYEARYNMRAVGDGDRVMEFDVYVDGDPAGAEVPGVP